MHDFCCWGTTLSHLDMGNKEIIIPLLILCQQCCASKPEKRLEGCGGTPSENVGSVSDCSKKGSGTNALLEVIRKGTENIEGHYHNALYINLCWGPSQNKYSRVGKGQPN